MSKLESKLTQRQLRLLKQKLTFWGCERLRNSLSYLRRGMSKKDFREICDDLSRDL